MSRIRPLLEPRSVAVIGASTDPAKSGGVLLSSLLRGDFAGTIHPINPRAEEIQGLRAHPSIGDVPEPVDLAFVVVRRELVHDAVAACADAGVRAVAIITAGFGEADEWGRAEHERLARLIAERDLLAIGPNTIGLVTMGGRLLGTFVDFPRWDDGPIAIASQSGIFAGALAQDIMAMPAQRLGIRHSVSIGNRSGVSEIDLLEAYAEDPAVEVIGFYLESFADAPRFLARAAHVKRTKPVVVLKPGRTERGARAAASHTGSLACDDTVVDHLLAQHGIVRVDDEEDLMAVLRAFSYAPLPRGPRLGIVTFSGAMGVMASDLATEEGLDLEPYAGDTEARIQALLPDWQRVGNPADLWPAIDIDRRAAMVDGLDAALADPGTDQVLGILLAVPNADFDDFRDAFAELREAHPDKPLHLAIRGTLRAEWTQRLDGLGIPIHTSLRLAVRAMAAATRHAAGREQVPESARLLEEVSG
jgi:acetyltransferase